MMDADETSNGRLDEELTRLLAERLPRHAAPYALRRRLAGSVAEKTGARRRRRELRRRLYATFGAVAAVAAALLLFVFVRPRPPTDFAEASVAEHVRLLARARPVDVESGGLHQVKPWFTGRIDFAPRVAFAGDDEFPLVGGSLAELDGRKAAAFVWKRRLHSITLFVFRADGLKLPRGTTRIGRLDVDEQVKRGFDVLEWRDGDLGYCLVSDVSRAELETLAARIAQ
jgi:anti-sigma factor RsiW